MLGASRKDRLEAWKRSKKRISESNSLEVPAAKKVKPQSPAVTPTKLHFPNEKENNVTQNRPTAQSIKDKLIASAKKRKKVMEEKIKTFEVAKAPTATTVPPVQIEEKKNSLRTLAGKQLEIVHDMIKIAEYVKARDFLKQLKEETPDILKVGDYWITLANIELKLGNICRAKSVFVIAMEHIQHENIGNFLQECCTFMKSELFHGQPLTPLDSLLEEPFSEVFESVSNGEMFTPEKQDIVDGDLSSYLGFNPNTTVKKTRNLSKPMRVQTEALVMNSALKAPKCSKSHTEEVTGSIIVLEAVESRKKLAEQTGSNLSMTPVRRSARKKKTKSPDIQSVLKQTDFTYVPNKALSTTRRSSVHFKIEANDEEEIL